MNQENPYSHPAGLIVQSAPLMDVPDEITSPIRHGWIAATISGTLTLAASVIGMVSHSGANMFGAWNLLDVALIALLAFGIYRRSRIASTLMLIYFVISKILIMKQVGRPDGIVLALVFVIFYFRAVLGTFRYHRFVKMWKRNPPQPRPRLSEDPMFRPQETAPDELGSRP